MCKSYTINTFLHRRGASSAAITVVVLDICVKLFKGKWQPHVKMWVQ